MSKDFFGEEEDILNDDEELFTLTDEDGNEIKFEFLDLIELENENYVVLYPIENNNDEVANVKLPQTGAKSKVILIIVAVIFVVILYKRRKRYKNIK